MRKTIFPNTQSYYPTINNEESNKNPISTLARFEFNPDFGPPIPPECCWPLL